MGTTGGYGSFGGFRTLLLFILLVIIFFWFVGGFGYGYGYGSYQALKLLLTLLNDSRVSDILSGTIHNYYIVMSLSFHMFQKKFSICKKNVCSERIDVFFILA